MIDPAWLIGPAIILLITGALIIVTAVVMAVWIRAQERPRVPTQSGIRRWPGPTQPAVRRWLVPTQPAVRRWPGHTQPGVRRWPGHR